MENFDPNFIDNAWQNMHQILDEQMPQQPKGKFKFWHFALAAAVVSAVACIFMYSNQQQHEAAQTLTNGQSQSYKIEQLSAKIASPNIQKSDAIVAADAKINKTKSTVMEKDVFVYQNTKLKISNVKNIDNQVLVNKNFNSHTDLSIQNVDNQIVVNKNLDINTDFTIQNADNQKLETATITTGNKIEQTPPLNIETIEKGFEQLTSNIKAIEYQQNMVFQADFPSVNALKKARKKIAIGYDIYAHGLVSRGFGDGFQLGIDATHEFREVWKISAGLQFQRYNLYYKALESVCVNCDLADNTGKFNYTLTPQNVTQGSFIYADNTIISPSKANRYSVPLMISYRVLDNFRLFAGMNLNFTQRLKNNLYSNLHEYDSNASLLNAKLSESVVATSPYNFTQDANLGLSYTLQKWTVETGLQIQNKLSFQKKKIALADNFLGNAPGQQQYDMFYVGLRYKIK